MSLKKAIAILALVIAVVVGGAVWLSNRAPADPGFQRVGWETLSNFKYDTYEVLNETDGGRPFTRSNDVIPPHVKALDGREVAITGFVMPLRLKRGLVTEFLLFKDQAACCFGPAAKMNHYVRVKMRSEGFPPPAGTLSIYRVYGLLRVGEINVQGYLTGIYELEAEKVVEQRS